MAKHVAMTSGNLFVPEPDQVGSTSKPTRVLPARLRALQRIKLSKLEHTSPFPVDRGGHLFARSSPRSQSATGYHPAPFTPANVPAIYSSTSPRNSSMHYGKIFQRKEAISCEPLVHWRLGLLAPDDPTFMKESAFNSLNGFRNDASEDQGKLLRGTESVADAKGRLPEELWSVAPDGSEKLYSKSAIDLKTLAEWLDDSRPIDQSGAYSILLLAKDLIRRLMSDSVHVWNSAEDQLRSELANTRVALEDLEKQLRDARLYTEKLEAALHKDLDSSEKQMRTAERRLLAAQMRSDKIERDFLLARDELVQVRDQKAMLEGEVHKMKGQLADSVWNGGKVMELIKSLKTQPLKTRRRLVCAMLENEAQAGTMYMFCKEMSQHLADPKAMESQISLAFSMHLVDGSDDPMQILRDLTAQRQRVLGRRGIFGIDAVKKSAMCQTDPMPEPKPIVIEKTVEKKRRTFVERPPTPPAISITPVEILKDIQEDVPQKEPEPEEEPAFEQSVVSPVTPSSKPKTPKSKPMSPASPEGKSDQVKSATPNKKNQRDNRPTHKGEMMPGAILKWIPKILEDKLIQDEVDAGQRGVLTMKAFISEYFPRKYGLPALAQKALAELMNGLKKYSHTHKRIQLFAACCGMGSDDKDFAKSFTQFMLKCIVRCMPVETISESLSKKECEVEVSTVDRALEWLFQGEFVPVHPNFRGDIIKMCKVGKTSKNQPCLDIDEFLSRCMKEFCAIKGVDPPAVLKYIRGEDS